MTNLFFVRVVISTSVRKKKKMPLSSPLSKVENAERSSYIRKRGPVARSGPYITQNGIHKQLYVHTEDK